MPELLQQSIDGNELLIFTVALFFSALSGQKMEPGQRVALVYSYCLIVSYFSYIDVFSIVFGSLIVLFLTFEVFSSDKMLVHLFSFKYKCLDFLYRLLLEYHGVFFYLMLFVSATSYARESIFAQIAFLILVIALAAITSRQRFSTKSISRIIEELEALGGDPASCSFDDADNRKLKILVYLEDDNFLKRDEHAHVVSAKYLASKVALHLRKNKLTLARSKLSSFSSLRRYIRGYGTIEMQIIRNVGLNFGSYRLMVRRKLFEILFSQAVFNSYIDQLSKNSPARKNIKKWILLCYLKLVSIKIDDIVHYPTEERSTFQQLFNRKFSEITEEEFFVWCLGLPHYENGVGERAVELHIDAIEHFELCKETIDTTIANLSASHI